MTIQGLLDDRPISIIPVHVDTLVIGAGPTGLGAASRLHQHGVGDWIIVDELSGPGGLAQTETTPEGFLFDLGGHVIFSHYKYFDQLVDWAKGGSIEPWNIHQRISYIWMKNRWIPYPFQTNLFCLDTEDKISCVNGLIDAVLATQGKSVKASSFDDWITKVMGDGIGNLFMRPYNFKVWAFPPSQMQCDWLGERVATVNLKNVTENIIRNVPNDNWGPNAVFRFPKEGGTGSIWKRVAGQLPREKQFYDKRIIGIDFDRKLASFSDGSLCHYNKMISTLPLDRTLSWFGREDLCSFLQYSSTHVIGLGLRGTSLHDKKCWMYFPENDCPFYRCTVFSYYADTNCPSRETLLSTMRIAGGEAASTTLLREGPYWSLMFEVSESLHKPVESREVLIESTIRGAINTKLISPETEIVSIFYKRLERGYPTPSLHRDNGVVEGLRLLKEKDVWSRGRFGAWKYEVGNQDHSVMQGVEAVDNILFGSPEMTVNYPNIVNGKRNEDLIYKD